MYASSECSGVCVGGGGILRWFRVVLWSVSEDRSIYAQIFADHELIITFVCVEVL